MAADLKKQAAPLHPEDLALAEACARGDTAAWDRFVLEYRPILYRAADAIDRTGTARELADALYAELFGLKERDGERQSLFRYFHGRSSLATWLRAVLAQRYVDHVRAHRRLESLPEEEQPAPASAIGPGDTDSRRFSVAMRQSLTEAVVELAPRDRLRLGCYYSQGMTLVQIGRLTKESEATVSRQLAKTRRAIRDAVERRLRSGHGFGDREIEECFAGVTSHAGDLDLAAMMGGGKPSGLPGRKESGDRRSKDGAGSREPGTATKTAPGSRLPDPGMRTSCEHRPRPRSRAWRPPRRRDAGGLDGRRSRHSCGRDGRKPRLVVRAVSGDCWLHFTS